MSRLKTVFLSIRSVFYPDKPYFGDHDPDAWYMKPATPGFQQAAWLIFALVGIAVVFLTISQNGGIWAK